MGVLRIPTSTTLPNYQFTVDLENTPYVMQFYWNNRMQAWFFSLLDVNLNELVGGRRVAINAPLLGRSRNAALPPGILSAVDTSGQGMDPGFADLGGRVQLVYVESTSL